MPSKASKFFTDNIPIMDGEAFIFKTPPSGDVWQFRTWIDKEKRQFRKSLRTKDVETAQRKARELGTYTFNLSSRENGILCRSVPSLE